MKKLGFVIIAMLAVGIVGTASAYKDQRPCDQWAVGQLYCEKAHLGKTTISKERPTAMEAFIGLFRANPLAGEKAPFGPWTGK